MYASRYIVLIAAVAAFAIPTPDPHPYAQNDRSPSMDVPAQETPEVEHTEGNLVSPAALMVAPLSVIWASRIRKKESKVANLVELKNGATGKGADGKAETPMRRITRPGTTTSGKYKADGSDAKDKPDPIEAQCDDCIAKCVKGQPYNGHYLPVRLDLTDPYPVTKQLLECSSVCSNMIQFTLGKPVKCRRDRILAQKKQTQSQTEPNSESNLNFQKVKAPGALSGFSGGTGEGSKGVAEAGLDGAEKWVTGAGPAALLVGAGQFVKVAGDVVTGVGGKVLSSVLSH